MADRDPPDRIPVSAVEALISALAGLVIGVRDRQPASSGTTVNVSVTGGTATAGECSASANSSTGTEAQQGGPEVSVPLHGPKGRTVTISTTAPTSAGVEVRFYVVWRNPIEDTSRPTVGVWFGSHPACWDEICSRLRCGTYPTSGARLRRANSWADALQLWHNGGPHPRPLEAPSIFRVD